MVNTIKAIRKPSRYEALITTEDILKYASTLNQEPIPTSHTENVECNNLVLPKTIMSGECTCVGVPTIQMSSTEKTNLLHDGKSFIYLYSDSENQGNIYIHVH